MNKTNNKRAASSRPDPTKSISRDWTPFSERLAVVLSKLKEDQYLILFAQDGNRFLQFACQGVWGFRVEVSSNQFLEGDDRLNRRETLWLCSHGWGPPTKKLRKANQENDPDGSPNFYIDFPASTPARDIASLSTETLACGLEFYHPSKLRYKAFESNGNALIFPELGLRQTAQEDNSLIESVLQVFREETGIADLKIDEDGDIAIGYGEILIQSVLLENKVRLCSGLISGVSESPALLHMINHLNIGSHGLRCVLHDSMVVASLDIPAIPFVPAHLTAALKEFSTTAEAWAIKLRGMFSVRDSAKLPLASNLIQ